MGFAVTDSPTWEKCKLFIMCELQTMEGAKSDFHRGGGWGSGGYWGEEKENKE
jgi:hypothetical protein